MSERPPAADPEELASQVDAVADVLYGLTPDEFSGARDQFIKQAREQKNQPLARELGKLRKPTQSAWLVNQLWRDQREVIEQLFQLSSELSQAQAQASGAALRELTAQRRQLENALLQQAIGLARQKGVHVSDSVAREAQETLGAALALPEVADEVRSGHLVKPASYAGFGAPSTPAPARSTPREPIDLAAIQRARAAQASARTAPAAPLPNETDDDAAAQRAAEEAARLAREEEERRRAAERRLQEARAVATSAEADLVRAERSLATADQRQHDLRQQLETLRDQLRRVEADVQAAESRAAEAQEARDRAEAALTEARQAVEQAERELRGL
jgi:chromosome segregation ATPase